MKKLYYSLLTLLAIIVLASCSSEKDGTACLKLIPEDAAVVMRVDLAEMADALGYNADTKVMLKKALASIDDADDEVRDKLNDIVDNPAEVGISGEHPLYFYVAPNLSNLVGLVGTTADKDKMVEMLNMLSDNAKLDGVEEVDGVSYLSIKQAAVFVADDWFLIGVGGDDPEGVAKDLKKLAEGDKIPVMDNADFKAMNEKKEQFAALISGRGLDAFVGKASFFGMGNGKEIRKVLNKILPGKLADVSLIGYGDMKDGVSTHTMELLTYSNEWEKAVGEFDAVLGKLSTDLLKYLSADGITMLANVDGAKLWTLVEKMATGLGERIDGDDMAMVRNMLASIKGDMGLNVQMYNKNQSEVTAYIATKDNAIVQKIASESRSDNLKQNGADDYTLTFYEQEWSNERQDFVNTELKGVNNFGYRQGYTYIVYNEKQMPQPFATPANAMKASQLKGKGFYMYMDFDMMAQLATGSGFDDRINREMASLFDYIEFYYEGKGKFSGKTVMADKKASLINSYINLISKIINNRKAYSYEDLEPAEYEYGEEAEEEAYYQDSTIVDY